MIEIKKLGVLSVFKKAPFPASMTVISFVLFVIVYLLLTGTMVEPFYLKGLLFALPFICFANISIFTSLGKMKILASTVLTIISIIVFTIASGYFLFNLAMEAATTVTTDINKYERVLELTNYPTNPLTRYFPEQIPENVKDVQFSYNPACLQGGENFTLKYKTDSDSIKTYINKFSEKAQWIGKSNSSEAEKHGLFGSLNIFDSASESFPSDVTIYLTYSRQYQPNDWNHGETSLIAISKEKNEILFLADKW